MWTLILIKLKAIENVIPIWKDNKKKFQVSKTPGLKFKCHLPKSLQLRWIKQIDPTTYLLVGIMMFKKRPVNT